MPGGFFCIGTDVSLGVPIHISFQGKSEHGTKGHACRLMAKWPEADIAVLSDHLPLPQGSVGQLRWCLAPRSEHEAKGIYRRFWLDGSMAARRARATACHADDWIR